MGRLDAALAYKPQTSWCQRCRQDKPVSEFSEKGSWCRKCSTAWHQMNRARNPESYRRAQSNYDARAKPKRMAWREKNKSIIRQKLYRWMERNKDRVRSYHAKRRAHVRGNGGSYTAAEWQAMVEWFGGNCLCCGGSGPLAADHVVPVSKGGTSWISNIQPLCYLCNFSKGNRHSTDYRDPEQLRLFLEVDHV